MKIRYKSLSDTGQVRQNNEDAFGEFVPDDLSQIASLGVLFVVADGMGGHRGGEIASGMAVRLIGAAYRANPQSNPTVLLTIAFDDANEQILGRSVSDTSLFGMGTTCTAMMLRGGNAYFAHIGDSRAYLYRGDEILQITQDHSLVGEMVRSGILTDEDARKRFVARVNEAVNQQLDISRACDEVLKPSGEVREEGDRLIVPHERAAPADPEAIVNDDTRPDIQTLWWLTWATTRALRAAEERKITHGGIQFSSLYRDESGRLKLGDFGIAQAYETVCGVDGRRYVACTSA
ncbi:MAG: protein phosphatase 2C domain-containing protein, partial [Candidatus Krumholzibacteriota bacterium]|nr:protein phosphatase 2C domain-containing protein [Candidatus Krumholzibacteriota bacterium]